MAPGYEYARGGSVPIGLTKPKIRNISRNKMEQLEMGFDGRRRRRKGAGRPRKTSGRSPHEARPDVTRHVPVHVSLRVGKAVGRLRGWYGYRAVRRALATGFGRTDFRVAQVSIQADHVHLIVEADDKY